MSLLLWILGSLIAISLIGDNPYIALALTALAGMAFGLNTYLDARVGSPPRAHPLKSTRFRVAQYGWLLDVAATALLVFPTRWMVVGFFLVLVSWSARAWAHQRIIRRTVFDLPILALLFMVPISLWASADLTTSLVPLGQIVAGINVFYALVERVETENDIHWAVFGLIGLGVIITLIAPFGVAWNKGKLFALTPIYSRFVTLLPKAINPNLLAGALVPILPVGAAVLLFAPFQQFSPRFRRSARGLLMFVLLLMLAILLLTQSRGGITAAAIGLLALIALKGRWVLGSAGFKIAIVIAVIALASLGTVAASRLDLSRIADAFFSTDTIGGLAGRQEVWSRAVYVLQDVPYTGIGLGMFSRAVQVLYPLFLVGPDVDIGYAHNIFLQVGADLGIPGLVAYVAILMLGILASGQAFRSAHQRDAGDLAAIALGLGVSLVAIMLHGLVDSAVWDTKPAILSWVLLALIAVVERRAILFRIDSPIGMVRQRPANDQPSNREMVAQRELDWFEREAQKRRSLDRILYDAPAFDSVIEPGFAFLEPRDGERVLDLGCGEGKETRKLAARGLRVIALDLSYAQLTRAQARLNGGAGARPVSFVQANAEDLPFADGAFRIVYGKAILHHVNIHRVAAEMRRVLQTNGCATFAEPLAHHPLFWLIRRLTPQFRSRDENPLAPSDLDRFATRVGERQIAFNFLLTPLAYPVRFVPNGERLFRSLHAGLQRLDAWLFASVPWLARYSWYAVVKIHRTDHLTLDLAAEDSPSNTVPGRIVKSR